MKNKFYILTRVVWSGEADEFLPAEVIRINTNRTFCAEEILYYLYRYLNKEGASSNYMITQCQDGVYTIYDPDCGTPDWADADEFYNFMVFTYTQEKRGVFDSE